MLTEQQTEEMIDGRLRQLEKFRDGDHYTLPADILRSVVRATYSTGALEGARSTGADIMSAFKGELDDGR